MKKKPLPTPAAPSIELATQPHKGTPRYGDYDHRSTAPAPAGEPNRRAASGYVFDLRNEQTIP